MIYILLILISVYGKQYNIYKFMEIFENVRNNNKHYVPNTIIYYKGQYVPGTYYL